MAEKILVIGACGQVGTELVENLQNIYGVANVIASDIKPSENPIINNGVFELLSVLDKTQIASIFAKYKPTIVYHLAALLSATAEANPKLGWELNMDGTFNVFDACLEYGVKRVFWPSSIAVFGPTTPAVMTPQSTILEPNTVYGITKLAGERYCEYYFNRYGLDVRSVRFPGLIGWKSLPGGGTTDYAVDIFHQALKTNSYECFLSADTMLPMMHMEDAVRATLEITNADASLIKIRSSYNIAGVSFNPAILTAEIKKHLPEFSITYKPDDRQKIADSWPQSIDDTIARSDWNWKENYNLENMVSNMLTNLNRKGNSINL
jgi:nucleoside-diphosphate-sugar epimerase